MFWLRFQRLTTATRTIYSVRLVYVQINRYISTSYRATDAHSTNILSIITKITPIDAHSNSSTVSHSIISNNDHIIKVLQPHIYYDRHYDRHYGCTRYNNDVRNVLHKTLTTCVTLYYSSDDPDKTATLSRGDKCEDNLFTINGGYENAKSLNTTELINILNKAT